MKYWFLVFTLFSLSCNLPKTLEGDYSTSGDGFGRENWHFNADGTFILKQAFDLGTFYSSGNYVVTNNSIHFTFAPLFFDTICSKMDTVAFIPQQRDSVILNFTIVDDSTLEQIPVVIQIEDSLGNAIASPCFIFLLDSTVKHISYKGELKITVQSLGYKKVVQSVKGDRCYNCSVRMKRQTYKSIYTEGFMDFRAKKRGHKIIFKYKSTETLVGLFREKQKTTKNKEKLIRVKK